MIEDYIIKLLKPDEKEAISIAVEEAGEMIQVAAKIIRHNALETMDNNTGIEYNNTELLTKELADVSIATDLLIERGLISNLEFELYKKEKYNKLLKYIHHDSNLEAVNRLKNKSDTGKYILYNLSNKFILNYNSDTIEVTDYFFKAIKFKTLIDALEVVDKIYKKTSIQFFVLKLNFQC